MGRAIVTTDVPGCRETVMDGENGYLVPMRDAGALSEAIEKLIDDPELRFKMGQRSRAIAEAEFDCTAVNEKTVRFYKRIFDDAR